MTAVEWLADEIIMLEEKLRLEEININDFMDTKDELVSKALEMEKEQIIDAFDFGFTDGCRYSIGYEQTQWQEGEIYYEETFK